MIRSRTFWLGLAAFLAVSLGPRLWMYERAAGPLAPGVMIAGLDVTSAHTLSEAAQTLNDALTQPVTVHYGDQSLPLRPADIGFRIDWTATLTEAASYRQGFHFWRGFAASVAHQPPPRVDVPLRFSLDTQALATWLNDVAASHDRAPIPPKAIAGSGQIVSGKPGQRLDAQASVPDLVAALTRADNREMALVIREEPAPAPTFSLLRDALQARLQDFPGIASVWVRDMRNRREIGINEEVAYAAMSTIKVAILEEAYRRLDAAPDVATTLLISETMRQSYNHTANALLSLTGDGSAEKGVAVLTDSLRRLGLRNTFMAAPYGQPLLSPPHIVTPANQRTDFDTKPDPYMQTTAKDMGLLMEMIVECMDGKGTLVAAYPDQIKPDECRQMVEWMGGVHTEALLETGVPAGTPIAHKHGIITDTHGDVAAIWGPNGPYIISVFLYQPEWLDLKVGATLMGDLSRITYEFLANFPG